MFFRAKLLTLLQLAPANDTRAAEMRLSARVRQLQGLTGCLLHVGLVYPSTYVGVPSAGRAG